MFKLVMTQSAQPNRGRADPGLQNQNQANPPVVPEQVNQVTPEPLVVVNKLDLGDELNRDLVLPGHHRCLMGFCRLGEIIADQQRQIVDQQRQIADQERQIAALPMRIDSQQEQIDTLQELHLSLVSFVLRLDLHLRMRTIWVEGRIMVKLVKTQLEHSLIMEDRFKLILRCSRVSSGIPVSAP